MKETTTATSGELSCGSSMRRKTMTRLPQGPSTGALVSQRSANTGSLLRSSPKKVQGGSDSLLAPWKPVRSPERQSYITETSMLEMGSTPLNELERAVRENYCRESDSVVSKFELSLASKSLSVKEIDLKDGGDFIPRDSLLQVLEEWKTLVSAMKENQVFLEYVANLWTAFRALHEIDRSLYRHVKSLVYLLAKTAENREREESTCRFVTLLEVMLSYCRGWTPSKDVSSMWKTIQQELPSDVAPVNFRRRAYRVLISRSWVPSSQGLSEACSIITSQQTIDVEKAPPKVRNQFDKIRGGAQPRYDCVNQVLERLENDENSCIAITSEKPGMGKTTLAAVVASQPSILQSYRVLWLNLPAKQLTYETYTKCLDDLCEQLSVTLEWSECVKRLEEPAFRCKREEAAMEKARDKLASAILDSDEKYLLVLDDVADDKDCDLFQFSERQSTIVTTANSLDGVSWTLTLGPMSEEELIGHFLTEAGFPSQHLLGLTVEVRTVVRMCEFHPLTVRTVGRWYGLKQVTAGMVEGMEELLKEMSSTVKAKVPVDCTVISEEARVDMGDDDPVSCSDSEEVSVAKEGHGQDTLDKENLEPVLNGGGSEVVVLLELEDDDDDASASEGQMGLSDDNLRVPLMFDILCRMMGPANIEGNSTTILFLLCVASMVVVFPERVPLDAVLLLWEQLLWMEPSAINEISQKRDPTKDDIRKRVWLIAEGLAYMGIISVIDRDGNPWVEFHHKLYKDFGLHLARKMDLGETYEKTAEEWNKAFVTAYLTHRLEGTSDHADDSSWEYAMEKLPSHIFRSKMFSMAETILSEEHFFRSRIDAMGWDRAIDMHVNDCMHLQQGVEDNNDASQGSINTNISPVFNITSALVSRQARDVLGKSEDGVVIEVSRALFKIGVALASNGYFDEAIEQFESAQNLIPQSQDLVASILYGAGWAFLAVNMSEKALKKLRACRKVMEDYGSNHALYNEVLQLQGEALVGECEYRDAAALFGEIVAKFKNDAPNSKIELGTTLNKAGRLYYAMGEVEKATESFNECLICKLESDETSADLSSVLSIMGDMRMEERKYSDACGYYERALQVLDTLDFDREAIEYCVLRGKIDYLSNAFAVGLESLERARYVVSETPKLSMDQSAYDLRCIARCYYTQGELEAAMSVLQDSLTLTNERPFSLERSFGLHDLAKCILDQKMVKEALVCLEQSLEIRILKLGECALVMDTLSVIGNVHMSLGAPDEALPVFEKVNELTIRITPDDPKRVARARYSIGDAYGAKKEYDEAKSNLLESISTLKEGGLADSPDVAQALQRLGDVEVEAKRLFVAFEFYGEALRIRQMYPEDRREIAETLHSVGVLTRKRGNLEPSLPSLQEALDIRRELGNAHETGLTLFELGNVLRLQSKPEDALRFYEESLEVLDDEDEIRASSYLALGHTKLSLKRDGEVLQCYERALEFRMKKFGRDNMKTGNVHRSLGLFQYLVHHGDEALLHLNEYMRVVELGHNEDSDDDDDDDGDIDYVLAVMLMFDIHRASGRDTQAKNLIELAKEICDESGSIRKNLPALAEMVERRHAPPGKDSSSKRTGLFSRLKLSEEAETQLSINAEDANVLRHINFVDD